MRASGSALHGERAKYRMRGVTLFPECLHGPASRRVLSCMLHFLAAAFAMSRRPFTSSLALACAFMFVAFAAPAVASDKLVWRGDLATGRAIMEDIAKEYAKQKKGTIDLQPFSTLSGLDAVASGSADIAGSARGKFDRRAEEAGLNFNPVALDAAVMVVHAKNPVSSLSLKQIHDLYYGRITNWKELGGPDKAINLYAIASPLDGVEYSLRELVYRKGHQPIAAPRLYLNTAKLEEAIAIDQAGLGLTTMARAHANKGLKMLRVENVAPSTASVADGSYPLYITLYIAEREASPKHEAVLRFLAFLDTPAAKTILRKHQLVPYGEAGDVAMRNEQRLVFIDTQVGRDAASVAALTGKPMPTPVAAPRATLDAATRISSTSATAQAARENLARAEQQKAEQAAAKTATTAKPAAPVAAATPAAKSAAVAAKPAAKKPAATAAAKPAPAKATATAAAKPAPKKPTATAAAKPASKKPAATAAAKPAPKKAEAAPAKPAATFGNVSGGAGTR